MDRLTGVGANSVVMPSNHLPEGTVKSRMAEALHQLNRILNPFLQDRPKPVPRTKESLLI